MRILRKQEHYSQKQAAALRTHNPHSDIQHLAKQDEQRYLNQQRENEMRADRSQFLMRQAQRQREQEKL